MFWYEIHNTPGIVWNGDAFTWTIGDLKVGEKRYLDVFVRFDNPGLPGQYDLGNSICNIAKATSDSVPEISDDACLILSGSCIKECEGRSRLEDVIWTIE
jgi:hypothetical protein